MKFEKKIKEHDSFCRRIDNLEKLVLLNEKLLNWAIDKLLNAEKKAIIQWKITSDLKNDFNELIEAIAED